MAIMGMGFNVLSTLTHIFVTKQYIFNNKSREVYIILDEYTRYITYYTSVVKHHDND